MTITRGRAARIAGAVALVASLAFLVWEMRELGIDLVTSGVDAEFVLRMVVALCIDVVALTAVTSGWASLVAHGSDRSFVEALAVNWRTQIGKYLPGNVFHLAGRQVLAHQRGWQQHVVATASGVETLLLPLVAMLIGAVGLLTGSVRDLAALNDALPGGAGFIALAIVAALVGVCVLAVLLWRRQDVRALLVQWRFAIAAVAGLHAVFLLLTGLAQAILLPGLPVGPVVVASAIAWVLGYITPGAPGGLGVREAVMVLLLGEENREVVLLGVLALRLVTVSGDLVLYAGGRLLDRRPAAGDR